MTRLGLYMSKEHGNEKNAMTGKGRDYNDRVLTNAMTGKGLCD